MKKTRKEDSPKRQVKKELDLMELCRIKAGASACDADACFCSGEACACAV